MIDTVVEQYIGEPASAALTMITTTPRLRAEFIDAASTIRPPLAAAIADRLDQADSLTAEVLAAAVAAAIQVALKHWAQPNSADMVADSGFIVVTDQPLSGLLREALDCLVPPTGGRPAQRPAVSIATSDRPPTPPAQAR